MHERDRRMDTRWRHRSCLCIASRGKNMSTLQGAANFHHNGLKERTIYFVALSCAIDVGGVSCPSVRHTLVMRQN